MVTIFRRPAELCDLSDIDHAQERVGRRFDNDDFCILLHRPANRFGIGRGKAILYPETFKFIGGEGMSSAVELVHHHHVVPGACKSENRGAHRGHAGAEQNAVFRAFQCANFLNNRLLIRGIEVARVGNGFPVQIPECRRRNEQAN